MRLPMRLRTFVVLLSTLLFVLSIPVGALLAQDGDDGTDADTPPQVQAAIDRLNALIPGVGEPDRIEDVIQQPSNNTNLGCTLVEGNPLAATVQAFRVGLVYGETTYVFFVSEDLSRVVGCDNVPSQAEAAPDTGPDTTPAPRFNCLLSSTQSPQVQAQPGDGAVLVGVVQRNRVYTVQGEASSPDGVRWYRIAYTATQNGWVLAANAEINGPDCALIPELDTSFAAPPPTATPSATLNPTPTFDAGTELEGEIAVTVTPDTAPADPATFPNSNCPLDFTGFLPTRFSADATTATLAPGVTLIARSEPATTAAAVGNLQSGAVEEIVLLDGPTCVAGVVWWLVTVEAADSDPGAAIEGWVPESSVAANRYYLEPPPADTPTSTPEPRAALLEDAPPISTSNAASLALIREIELDTVPTSAIATTEGYVAVIAAAGVTVYDYPALTRNDNLSDTIQTRTPTAIAPETAPLDDEPTALQFDQFGDFLAVGYRSGAVVLLELEQGILIELRDGHRAPVSSISFDPENRLMLTTSGTLGGLEPDSPDYSVILWDLPSLDASTATLEIFFDARLDIDGPVQNSTFTRSGIPVLRVPGAVLALAEDGSVDNRLEFDELNTLLPGNLVAAPASMFDDEDVVLFSGETPVAAWDALQNEQIGRTFAERGRLPNIDRLPADDTLILTAFQSTAGDPALFVEDTATVATLATLRYARPLYAAAFAADDSALLLLDVTGLRVFQVAVE